MVSSFLFAKRGDYSVSNLCRVSAIVLPATNLIIFSISRNPIFIFEEIIHYGPRIPYVKLPIDITLLFRKFCKCILSVPVRDHKSTLITTIHHMLHINIMSNDIHSVLWYFNMSTKKKKNLISSFSCPISFLNLSWKIPHVTTKNYIISIIITKLLNIRCDHTINYWLMKI